MPLHFVVDEPLSAQPGEQVTLTGAEAHHAATVRRIRVGEAVTVGDGHGAWLDAECAAVAPKEVLLQVTARTDVPAPRVRVELVQALAKGDRDELAVQAATELGVDRVRPWQSARSVSRWEGAKRAKGVSRWQQIAREAAKQAHRPWLPEVTDLTTLAGLVERAAQTRMFVLEPTAVDRLTSWLPDPADDREVVLVVGPEGGFTPDERDKLRRAGAQEVRLGTEVLRTSTAGPAALAIISDRLGRW